MQVVVARFTIPAVLGLFLLAAACANSTLGTQKRLRRADQAFQRNQLEQAASEYKAVLKDDHLNGQAYLGLARVRIRQQQLDEAEWALTRAVDVLKDWPDLRECYVALSDIYLRNHPQPVYIAAAGQMASLLLQKDANSFDGHRIMAEVWAAKAEGVLDTSSSQARTLRAKALQEFQVAASIKSGDGALLRHWAAALVEDHQMDRAKAIYDELNSKPDTDADVKLGLYRIALGNSNPASASMYVAQALALPHPNPNQLLDMADLAFSQGRLQDMRLLLAYTVKTGGQSERVLQLCTMAGETELARQTLESAIRRHPDTARQDLVREAELLARHGHDAEAAEVARKCLARFKDEFRCLAVEAYESSLRGDQAALDRLRRLTLEYAGYPILNLYLGSVLQRQGKFEEARFQFLSGLAGSGNNIPLRLALSKLELDMHKPEQARTDAVLVLSREPHNLEALDILHRAQTHTETDR